MNIIKLILSIFLFSLAASTTFAQNAISGRIFESGSGNKSPLVGANIYWSGTQIGTTSGTDGSYSITASIESGYLVFSYVGFNSDSVKYSGQQTIDMVLKASVQVFA